MEEGQSVAGLVPHVFARSPVFAVDVHVRKAAAEVPFHARSAAHQIAPKRILANLVVVSVARMLELMAVDKKVKDGKLQLVLLKKIGEADVTSEFGPDQLEATLTSFY